ncbi:translation initiation factor IF-2-like [Canis lupus dingo]|uniref:translation initiation factor IF-2-like n=1 Tax=Canis lupus dingo TaxID=286419 RepID=UPI0020C1E072|nr:translation initiation factor IF-2-like [Canis lupus dingo]
MGKSYKIVVRETRRSEDCVDSASQASSVNSRDFARILQLTEQLIPQRGFLGLQGTAKGFQDPQLRSFWAVLLSGSWENLPNRETEAQTTQGLAQGVWPPANLAGNITNPANIAGSWIHLGPSGQPSPPPEILGGLTAERGFSQRRPLPVPRLYSPSAQQKAKNQTASPSRKSRPLRCSPKLQPCNPREGLTGSAWRPAATEAHCSQPVPSPSSRKTLWGAPSKGPDRCLQAAGQPVGESEHRKRKPAGRGLGHSCHRRLVSGGFRGRGVLSLARPWVGAALLAVPIWKPENFDLEPLVTDPERLAPDSNFLAKIKSRPRPAWPRAASPPSRTRGPRPGSRNPANRSGCCFWGPALSQRGAGPAQRRGEGISGRRARRELALLALRQGDPLWPQFPDPSKVDQRSDLKGELQMHHPFTKTT